MAVPTDKTLDGKNPGFEPCPCTLYCVSAAYQYNFFTIKRFGNSWAKILYHPVAEVSRREDLIKHFDGSAVEVPSIQKQKKSDGSRFDSSLARAKSKVRELVLCNDWDYWCTFTLDAKKQDRYTLDTFRKKFAIFLQNYKRHHSKVDYVLVPERHKDGAWHLHGFIKGISPSDLRTNENGFLEWAQYRAKFGFMSMSPIKSKEKASSYILKYMSKDLANSVQESGAHLYYASRGLKHSETVYRGAGELLAPEERIFRFPYGSIVTVKLSEGEKLSDFFRPLHEPTIIGEYRPRGYRRRSISPFAKS